MSLCEFAIHNAREGPRTQRFIINKIQPRDWDIFRTALRCIKHWAARRCIYGKPMGYLNGSTWTFLLLKTYIQMGKRPQPSRKLLAEFFDMWDNWPWPEPVLLTDYIPDINDRKIEYESLVTLKYCTNRTAILFTSK